MSFVSGSQHEIVCPPVAVILNLSISSQQESHLNGDSEEFPCLKTLSEYLFSVSYVCT